MISLLDKQTDTPLGEISEGELQFLIDELEEEDRFDKDYYIDEGTVDYLESRKGSPHLIAMLRRAIGTSGSVDIRWTDDSADDDSDNSV